jgi:hypothetical protein
MTHWTARRDALRGKDEETIGQSETRLCTACGSEFQPVRSWQLQCSPRCRQRRYVQRRAVTPLGYYGA